MRSQGQVRFLKISSGLQVAAATLVVTLLGAWIVTMASMTISQYAANRDKTALLAREAKAASAESRVAEYREGLDTVASDLAQRQKFIEQTFQAHFGDLPTDVRDGESVSDSRKESGRTVDKVSAMVPEAGNLVRIEVRQIAFVERLTRYADRRAEAAADAIRKLGLNPNAMIMSASSGGKGGPFIGLATSRDGTLDPRFRRLGASLARMEGLERGLDSIPQVRPASVEAISSGFGYRSDPFSGGAAFHNGIDFKGPRGAPIFAAAKGVVSFAGVRQGYGNCIEISHGNGLMTRYAHMSRMGSSVGEKVGAGEVIGAIGNTGRSTGPHLHFEVRINDRPVNPRPFLEASRNVRQENGSGA
ncbi:MAG: M23 family metallopeptidase [Novosphingobium sp.]|nr:M23 family metallopeptidase [Novosphingobium sp.]